VLLPILFGVAVLVLAQTPGAFSRFSPIEPYHFCQTCTREVARSSCLVIITWCRHNVAADMWTVGEALFDLLAHVAWGVELNECLESKGLEIGIEWRGENSDWGGSD
jgi:hypothetical protein